MRVAYLLGSAVTVHGPVTHRLYVFGPWSEVDEADWPGLGVKVVRRGGCCGRPSRVDRVFGTEEEVRTGQVATYWR